MLTVLHTESSAGWGGQENRTLHESLGLKRLGERVLILCTPGSKLGAAASNAGIEVLTHPMRGSYDICAVWRIMEIIKKEKVDIVNTHSGVDSFLGAVAGRLSSRRPRPVIVRTRHLALPITSRMSYSILPHMVVTVSEYVRGYLVREKGIPAAKVKAIPTGIDLERFDPDKTQDTLRAGLDLKKNALIVGTVAILRRKKGHHVLLDAIPRVIKAVPKAVFVFAGDGPQRENIEARIKELGIGKNVRLLGLRRDVPSVIKGMDIFVLPTLQEALGTSLVEASAMGKAVVSTRVGGVPEAVIDGKTGILVAPEDSVALADAIIKLLKDSPLRERMGKEGSRMAVANYSTDIMAARMRGLYLELVNPKKR